MIVVDASTVIELLLDTQIAKAAVTRLLHEHDPPCAPELLDLEVASALRSAEARGVVTGATATQALSKLAIFPLSRYPHAPLVPRIWELRGNLTAYDGAYVALAEALGAPLITFDAKLAAAPNNRATIELLS